MPLRLVELVAGGLADALVHDAGEALHDDGAERAQLVEDGVDLEDELTQHEVLGALRVDEVVAADLVGALEGAVDAAVALLHARRIPGHVDVEEIGAVRLEVDAFAGGVGGDQDAHGMLVGRRCSGAVAGG